MINGLDSKRRVKKRLFREHCVHEEQGYVKDLKFLKKDLKDVILVDVNLAQ